MYVVQSASMSKTLVHSLTTELALSGVLYFASYTFQCIHSMYMRARAHVTRAPTHDHTFVRPGFRHVT